MPQRKITSHPDAKLIGLGRRFGKTADALERKLTSLGKVLDRDATVEALMAPVEAIEAEIASCRATTIDGLIVKGYACTRWGVADAKGVIADSILRDLALLAAHPARADP